ncbi:diacylglycerol kinase family protein [Salimicrobium salexigens]|uniref:Undecaprenol kinase/diacylglycerol kinase (ATP) n=1 Tax=Salimicrobium salexigens TaxID=908941 RepID=A0ABY1KN89_9BACI|nr:diacylglycerol kinase family protein [Salimicrobium salexigens]SIS52662.1 undecaprenol kinase/diacylglycerol kinase (ATP) [Salimicrobium salexigens]
MNSDLKGSKGNKRIGFRFALSGILAVVKAERNLRIHCFASVAVLLTGIFLSISPIEWAVLFLTMGLVLSLEVVNSVIERVMDFIHPSYHQEVKVIKDASAGAVLIAACFAVMIALVIFVPNL